MKSLKSTYTDSSGCIESPHIDQVMSSPENDGAKPDKSRHRHDPTDRSVVYTHTSIGCSDASAYPHALQASGRYGVGSFVQSVNTGHSFSPTKLQYVPSVDKVRGHRLFYLSLSS